MGQSSSRRREPRSNYVTQTTLPDTRPRDPDTASSSTQGAVPSASTSTPASTSHELRHAPQASSSSSSNNISTPATNERDLPTRLSAKRRLSSLLSDRTRHRPTNGASPTLGEPSSIASGKRRSLFRPSSSTRVVSSPNATPPVDSSAPEPRTRRRSGLFGTANSFMRNSRRASWAPAGAPTNMENVNESIPEPHPQDVQEDEPLPIHEPEATSSPSPSPSPAVETPTGPSAPDPAPPFSHDDPLVTERVAAAHNILSSLGTTEAHIARMRSSLAAAYPRAFDSINSSGSPVEQPPVASSSTSPSPLGPDPEATAARLRRLLERTEEAMRQARDAVARAEESSRSARVAARDRERRAGLPPPPPLPRPDGTPQALTTMGTTMIVQGVVQTADLSRIRREHSQTSTLSSMNDPPPETDRVPDRTSAPPAQPVPDQASSAIPNTTDEERESESSAIQTDESIDILAMLLSVVTAATGASLMNGSNTPDFSAIPNLVNQAAASGGAGGAAGVNGGAAGVGGLTGTRPISSRARMSFTPSRRSESSPSRAPPARPIPAPPSNTNLSEPSEGEAGISTEARPRRLLHSVRSRLFGSSSPARAENNEGSSIDVDDDDERSSLMPVGDDTPQRPTLGSRFESSSPAQPLASINELRPPLPSTSTTSPAPPPSYGASGSPRLDMDLIRTTLARELRRALAMHEADGGASPSTASRIGDRDVIDVPGPEPGLRTSGDRPSTAGDRSEHQAQDQNQNVPEPADVPLPLSRTPSRTSVSEVEAEGVEAEAEAEEQEEQEGGAQSDVPDEGTFERFLHDIQLDLRSTLAERQRRDRERDRLERRVTVVEPVSEPVSSLSGEGDGAASAAAAAATEDANRHLRTHVPTVDVPLNWWRMYRFPPRATTAPAGSPSPLAVVPPVPVPVASTTPPGTPPSTSAGVNPPPLANGPTTLIPAIFVGLRHQRNETVAIPVPDVRPPPPSFPSPLQEPTEAAGSSSNPPHTHQDETRGESVSHRDDVLHYLSEIRAQAARDQARREQEAAEARRRQATAASRSYVIWVIGGFYPEHMLATPNMMMGQFDHDDFWALAEFLGQVKPPTASRDDIERSGLQVIKAEQLAEYAERKEITSNTTDRCLICLSDYEPEEDVRILSCHHGFHKDCVDQWFTTGRNNCPACRTKGVTVGDATEASSSS